MSSDAAIANLKSFHSPQTVISRFIARRTMKSAAFVAIAFGILVASKADGYATAYPTLASRTKLAGSFANNIGLRAIFGAPNHISSVTGFTTWNTSGAMMIIGAIWAFLIATKTFRGEEDAGRWELLLSGQTTARRAALNVLAGLSASLAVLYVISSAAFIGVGKIHAVNFSTTAALFLSLSSLSVIAIFVSVGALASQLMPTRRRAASFSAAFFGLCFLIRAVADTTNAHWLLNVTPLGWVEKLQPLYGSNPIWLLPIAGLLIVINVFTIFLAGRRDLDGSIFADKDSSRPHTMLLNSPFPTAIRLTRSTAFGWLIGITFIATFFGLLTKSAAQAFSDSSDLRHALSHVDHSIQQTAAVTFLGVIFLLVIIIIMSYAASASGAIREEEAEGYLDNFLVRPVSRLQWLYGRITLSVIVIMLAGLLTGIGAWVGSSSQHVGVSFHSLILAGINNTVPAFLVLGIGIFSLGVIPRLTTVLAYGSIAWSFLILIIGSGINLNHWILDTSILQHVSLAPSVNPDWKTNLILICIGLVLCFIGSLVFNRRDLATE